MSNYLNVQPIRRLEDSMITGLIWARTKKDISTFSGMLKPDAYGVCQKGFGNNPHYVGFNIW
jgi:hypothetical protein